MHLTCRWRDCLLNLSFDADPDQVVCELQLSHRKLMIARKSMAGHADYVLYRSAVELKEASGHMDTGTGQTTNINATIAANTATTVPEPHFDHHVDKNDNGLPQSNSNGSGSGSGRGSRAPPPALQGTGTGTRTGTAADSNKRRLHRAKTKRTHVVPKPRHTVPTLE